MLKKRIIPCLDIKDGRTVKGVNFVNLRDAGDPAQLAELYAAHGADELVFLDITASIHQRKTLAVLVERIAERIDIPFTVGGGISSTEDVRALLQAGADKISVNSSVIRRPELINEISSEFGNQCLVVAIDAKGENGKWEVYIDGGRTATRISAIHWAQEAQSRGAGEILLTSMNRDGTKSGFDHHLVHAICDAVNLPVIASGGAGSVDHFVDLFSNTNVDAALAAGIFHFGEITIPELKNYLIKSNIPVR